MVIKNYTDSGDIRITLDLYWNKNSNVRAASKT